MPSYYSSAEMTLGQLKELLAIYHGKQSVDLNSKIPVVKSRVKLLFAPAMPDSHHFIMRLEDLIHEMENLQVKDDDFISIKYKIALKNLIKSTRGKLTQPEFLLSKRIATILHESFYPEINPDWDAVSGILSAMFWSISLRIAFEGPSELAFFQVIMHLACWYREMTQGIEKSSEVTAELIEGAEQLDEENPQPLQIKCAEYAQKAGLPEAPNLRLFYQGSKSGLNCN